MTASQRPVELRLRPHHIMCEPFMVLETFDRGEAFNALAARIKEALESESDTLIEVIEGTDELCQTCPLCRDGRCQSPEGDETAVRKWDAIVLQGLGISYGDRLSAGDLMRLIKRKLPLKLCLTKCRWKNACRVMLSR
ncbi:MAG: DUF1284 domain-containing protein [Dehalococcoidia bacterium]|nr:DUF1284 domain-containing protein [Dehalococcoidia bacterium]